MRLRVTRKWAAAQLACPQMQKKFFSLYPNGLTLTRKNLLRAVETMPSRSLAWFAIATGLDTSRCVDLLEEHMRTPAYHLTHSVRRKRNWANALADALELP